MITTIAGSGVKGYSGDGGPAVTATLSQPSGVAVDAGGRILVADTSNNVVRAIVPAGSKPLLSVSKVHTGSLAPGQNGALFTITVSNSALAGPSTGTVTVTENPAAGLTVASMSGSGWSCSTGSCSRSDTLLAGSTYPPINVTTNVISTARSQATNQAFVSGGGAYSAAGADLAPVTPMPLRFVPLTPCRIADTRTPNGAFGGPQIAGGGIRSFTIPASACSVPSNAQAYSVNVAVVPAGPLGYLTVWPAGQTQPLASTLNSLDGRIKSNAAIVPAGIGGAISVFASNPTDVVLDINGYFVPATDVTALGFYPITPCRIADTRIASAPLGGPSLAGGQRRTFPILASSCNIPATAQAYSLNFAAVPKGPLGYVTAWPSGQNQPLVSSLNAPTGTVTANAAIVPAGAGGSIDLFASNATDFVIDISGYFAPMTAGGLSLYNVTPCRVLDSRSPSGTPPFSGTRVIAATDNGCGVPATAQAHVLSATVVPPGPLGYLTLWPQGQAQPNVATLNALDASITSNMAIVPTSSGVISAFPSNPVHLILDIFGYFAP